MNSAPSTLGDLGPIRVSDRAAREFAAALPRVGHPPRDIESARDWLADLLTEARPRRSNSRSGASVWRFSRRSVGLDITAFVDVRQDESIVTHVNVRADTRRGGSAARQRRLERRAAARVELADREQDAPGQ